jgi:hypothetical protein
MRTKLNQGGGKVDQFLPDLSDAGAGTRPARPHQGLLDRRGRVRRTGLELPHPHNECQLPKATQRQCNALQLLLPSLLSQVFNWKVLKSFQCLTLGVLKSIRAI